MKVDSRIAIDSVWVMRQIINRFMQVVQVLIWVQRCNQALHSENHAISEICRR